MYENIVLIDPSITEFPQGLLQDHNIVLAHGDPMQKFIMNLSETGTVPAENFKATTLSRRHTRLKGLKRLVALCACTIVETCCGTSEMYRGLPWYVVTPSLMARAHARM